MKICMAVGFPFPGTTGTPLHAIQVSRKIKETANHIFVVQFRTKGNLEKDFYEGIEVFRIPICLWFFYFIYLLLKFKPDIIHAEHVSGFVPAFIPAKILGIPIVFQAHSFWTAEIELEGKRKGPLYWIHRYGESLFSKWANFIITFSKEMKKYFVRMKVNPQKIEVIYPSVDLNLFHNHKTNVDIKEIKERDKVIMYTGNFSPWQGVDLLLESIPYVIEKIEDVKFVLIGGRDHEILGENSQASKYKDKIIFLTRQSYADMPAFMARADILVIPRPDMIINYTTPRKMGEYLAMGKAIVATDVGDHKKILVDNECGIITKANARDFANGLIEVLKGEKLRKKLGSNARKVASDMFDWNNSIKLLIEIYYEIRK